jgi:hypothetical protein
MTTAVLWWGDTDRGFLALRARSMSSRPGSAALAAQIDQATGMLTEQLETRFAEAFVRLCAYAYANDLRLANVAHDIVARRLRMRPDLSPDRGSDALVTPRSRVPAAWPPGPRQTFRHLLRG